MHCPRCGLGQPSDHRFCLSCGARLPVELLPPRRPKVTRWFRLLVSAATPEPAKQATRVLIVDDQEPFRLAARMVVEATEGFEVVGEAETGEEGVELARTLEPDLVLMDVNLPGINGLDATRQILRDSGRV